MTSITLLCGFFLLALPMYAGEPVQERLGRPADASAPIAFTERGISFYVFLDGGFDFNTVPAQGGVYFRTGRNNIAPTAGVRIEYDVMGRIRRVGNVFMNYDNQGRIKRIGSVVMQYNRFALQSVGGLQIRYNARGQFLGTRGRVNSYEAPLAYAYQQTGRPVTGDYYYRKNGQ